MHQFESLPPTERFALILNELFRAISHRGSPGFRVVPIAVPLLALIWTRLRRLRNRFLRALATPYVPRRRRPGIARKAQARPKPASPYTVPRHRGWLLLLIQETGGAGSQLAHCLNQPDAMALIAADPRLGRILRPLCHALFIRPFEVPCLYPSLYPRPAPDPEPSAPPIQSEAPPQAVPIAEPPAASPPAANSPQTTPPARYPPPRPPGTAPPILT